MEKITPQDLIEAYKAVSEEEGVTWHKVLETLDNGDKLCLAVGIGEGFDEPTVCAKIGVLAGNSGMTEYDMDFIMPYDEESGEVFDTDSAIGPDGNEADYYNEQALKALEFLNSGELIASGCYGKKGKGKKKPIKSGRFIKSGAGAGYDIVLEGIELDNQNFEILEQDTESIHVKVPVKPCIVDKWSARSYYDGIDSDWGGYVDNDDRKINGGFVKMTIDIWENETAEEVVRNIPDYIDIKASYGWGWIHTNLPEEGMKFDYDHIKEPDIGAYGEIHLDEVDLKCPDICADINAFFANPEEYYDNIESSRKPLKSSVTFEQAVRDFTSMGKPWYSKIDNSRKPVKSDWKREAEFMNDRIRDDNLLYQVFKIEDEHFGGNFENPDNWDGTHIVYTIENGEITNTEIVDSFEDVIDDGNKYYLSADRDTGYRDVDYVLDRIALWQERNNRGITSSRKPIKSGITYNQALDMFTSEGKPWGDYWEMQQDWEAYKDGLVRDGQVEYEEERLWDNPCTPDTFKSWIESSKKPIQSMIIHQEITFDDFEPWSGARDTYERIMKADLGDEFDALITELYPDGCTETQINDILWFDADWVYECLGMSKEDEDDDGIEPIDSGCHGKKKGKKKAVKSSMSVRDLPREALQELKQRYYQEMTGDDLSYGEMAAIDDIVTDEEVFDEYDGTNFTEDDFFCLAK